MALFVPAHDDGRIGEGIDYSLVKREKARAFHKARDDLARFWNVWAPAIKTAHIVSHFEDARREIVVVSWLEPAWVLSTEDDGEGKKDLFRLAHRIMRS